LEFMPRRWRRLLALVAGPAAIAVFAGYQAAVLGDALAFIHGQALWAIPRSLRRRPRTGLRATTRA